MKFLSIASVFVLVAIYARNVEGWGCSTVVLPPGSKISSIVNTEYDLTRAYVTIFGLSDFLGISTSCPDFPPIFGGNTAVNLGRWGNVTFGSDGRGSNSFITAALFTAGTGVDFQIIYACTLASLVEVIAIYRKKGSDEPISTATDAITAAGISLDGKNALCASS